MKLIKTKDKFILVSDEEIKEGDIGYIPFEGGSIKTIGKHFADDWVKVISKNPDFSLLNEEDCKTIGWYDVEKLADIVFPINNKTFYERFDDSVIERSWEEDINEDSRLGFIEGFRTVQSLNDKKFSLEDMRNAIQFGLDDMYGYREGKDGHTEVQKDKYIQSLQQTSWDVEVEMEEKDIPEDNELKVASDGGYYSKPTSYVRITRPKITNNSIKVLKIL